MAGPRPDDPYNPVPQVSPNAQAPNDYLSVRADPAAFGSQIGEATTQLGKTIQDSSNKMSTYVLQKQGLANEHEANQAELQLTVDNGQTYNKFKGLSGLEASNAADEYVQQILQNNAKIRGTISNPAAQKAYDLLATRRMSFTITDINSRAGDERRSAYRQGNLDSVNLSVDRASRVDVASDPNQFNFELGNVIHQVNTMYTAPDYGKYQSLRPVVNPDGTLKFDDSPEGRVAQSDYDNYLNMATGKAWENRISTLAYDPEKGSVEKAVAVLNENSDKIPAATYSKLSKSLAPAYHNEQARQGADAQISTWDQRYINQISAPSGSNQEEVQAQSQIEKLFPGSVVTSTQRSPEKNAAVGGVPDSMHLPGKAIDFVPPKGVTLEEVTQKLKQAGIPVTEALNEKDHFHIGWQSKGEPDSTQTSYTSKADFYRDNYSQIVQEARESAEKMHPGDSTFADTFIARTEQKINNEITQQNLQDRVSQDTVLSAIYPKSGEPAVTNVSQLENSQDPKVRSAWASLVGNNPVLASNIQNKLITSASRGASLTYGTQFYDTLMSVLEGKTNDPSQLVDSVDPSLGKDSPLTNKGFGTLTSEIKAVQGNYPFAQAEANFLKQSKAKITGGFNNPVVNKAFETFLSQAVPLIQSERASGKNAAEIFGPKTPLDIMREGALPQADKLGSIMSPSVDLSGAKGSHLDDIKDGTTGLAELKKRIANGTSTKKAASDYALKRGWIRPTPPPVPAPQ